MDPLEGGKSGEKGAHSLAIKKKKIFELEKWFRQRLVQREGDWCGGETCNGGVRPS